MNETISIEKILTKSGLETLKINDYYIHSKYNPIQEAERFINQFYKENHKTILFGFGLGYIAEELKKKLGNKFESNLFIIDPLKEVLSSYGKINEYESYSFDDLNKLIHKIKHTDIQKLSKVNIICSPNYDKLFPEQYLKLLQEIKQFQHSQIIELNTSINLAVSWQENFVKNRFYIVHDRSLKTLKKKIQCPVILVSGGPSLTKQLETLKKVKDKVLIVVAGSAIGSLNKAGIEPDLVVSIDPKVANLRHYEDINFNNTTLVYMPENYYKIRELFKSAFSFVPSYDPEYQMYFKEKFNVDLPLLGYGASCANYALAIISYISDSPVAIIGQDLAYTNGQSHAEGNKNLWKVNEDIIKKRGLFYTEGYYGDKVLTSSVFYNMKQTFEELHNKIGQNSQVFNCTEGGIKLKGFENLPFKTFCDLYCEDQVKKIDMFSPTYFKESTIEHLNSLIINEKEESEQLKRLLADGIHLLKKCLANGFMDDKTSKKLNKIEKNLSEKLPELNMHKILHPISIRVNELFKEPENETKQQKFSRVLEMNLELFKGIKEAIEKVSVFNNELIEKIQNLSVGEKQ